ALRAGKRRVAAGIDPRGGAGRSGGPRHGAPRGFRLRGGMLGPLACVLVLVGHGDGLSFLSAENSRRRGAVACGAARGTAARARSAGQPARSRASASDATLAGTECPPSN